MCTGARAVRVSFSTLTILVFVVVEVLSNFVWALLKGGDLTKRSIEVSHPEVWGELAKG